jgi:hypothetical protein
MPETLFKKVDYSLSKLLHDIDHGDIGLPDIQRPFVWKPTQVRDLFDSMYRGFPVGYLLFWANDSMKGVKPIGTDAKQSPPRLLIVDGQQRLTSLYAVLKGVPVLDDQYRKSALRIAFHPPTERFEVADAAIAKDPEFVPDISDLWKSKKNSYKAVSEYVSRLRESRTVSDEQEESYASAIDHLYDLLNYPFTAMEISSSVDEEKVAEIFVRINSKGVQLNQGDFILTLLSVFWDDGRHQLEEFSRRSKHLSDDHKPSSFNHILQPDPDQLLRVEIAYGFHRAVLRNVYSVLRGKDLETGRFSASKRDEQFAILKEAQRATLDLTNWHEFLKAIAAAGYRSRGMIMSRNALLYAYALFLIGRERLHVDSNRLRRLIARWFFASAVAARFSGSFESMMESELTALRDIKDIAGFEANINHTVDVTLTNDFWNVMLPDELATSAARTPSLYAYHAALCVLKSPVLFSAMTVWELCDPVIHGKKANLERHHLFPKGYLKALGISDRKMMNQIANQTLLEWPDNIKISSKAPRDYVPALRDRISTDQWERMQQDHALPDNWWEMEYEDFLAQRRQLMSGVVRRAYEAL